MRPLSTARNPTPAWAWLHHFASYIALIKDIPDPLLGPEPIHQASRWIALDVTHVAVAAMVNTTVGLVSSAPYPRGSPIRGTPSTKDHEYIPY